MLHMLAKVREAPNRKYIDFDEVMVFDPKSGLVAKGPAVMWPSCKTYLRVSKGGKQRSKLIIVQVPKHFENYDRFRVIIIPEE